MITERLSSAEWIRRVLACPPGLELMDWIRRRVLYPYQEGPALDSRNGEAPEVIFEELAKQVGFLDRLDQTAAAYFRSDESYPGSEPEIPVIHTMCGLVERLALCNANEPIRLWIENHNGLLRAEQHGLLAGSALDALAMTQNEKNVTFRDSWRKFWLDLWRNAPMDWQPSIYIGLRLADPEAAAMEIPELIERTKSVGEEPGMMLHGLWNQPGGRDVLLAWLKNCEPHLRTKVCDALRARLPEAEAAEELPPQSSKPLHVFPCIVPRKKTDWFESVSMVS